MLQPTGKGEATKETGGNKGLHKDIKDKLHKDLETIPVMHASTADKLATLPETAPKDVGPIPNPT